MLDLDPDMGCESAFTSAGSSSPSSGFSTPSTPTQSPCPPRAKPHRAHDPLWDAIRRRGAPVGPGDFRLLRRVGRGDVGTVYMCRLRGEEEGGRDDAVYAVKVVDRREVERKNKGGRAEAERRVLRCLDHPFLPTLYAEFDAAPDYSCVVLDFCAGGDLHSLRHRMPSGRFTVAAARFYAAEVLVALEYLHLHGIVYRDLKPENVLLRSDGHIMLSDFDLSFFSPSSTAPSLRCHPYAALTPRTPPRLVAEPLRARSFSFVGTHEYVAPEVAIGAEHGPAVDWWALGVFLYELLYGRTPFAGANNRETLRNVVEMPLVFPARRGAAREGPARDLIRRLLVKDPSRRLGAEGGATDVKDHRFFRRVKLALLRSQRPPVLPGRGGKGAGMKEEKNRFWWF